MKPAFAFVLRWDLKESWNDRLGSMLAYKSFFSERKFALTTSETASAVAQSCCTQMDELSCSLKEMARRALVQHQQEVVGALENQTCLEYFGAFRDIYLSMGVLSFCLVDLVCILCVKVDFAVQTMFFLCRQADVSNSSTVEGSRFVTKMFVAHRPYLDPDCVV